MRKRKVKRFNGTDGSYVDTNRRTKELLESDEELNPDLTTRLRSASPGSNIKRMDGDGGSYTSPRKVSFGEAFSEARRAGSKTFEFGGKRYTTELSSEKKSARSTAPTPDESADETARLARQAKITDSSKDSEGSGYAVPAIVGAGAAAALAKAAMGKREKKESLSDRVKAREAGKSQSGSTVGKMPGSSLSDPYSMQLGSDLDVKRTLRGNKRMGMDSRDTEFKKGGKIKKMASGGKSSTASSRADGIAQRGKTRGRIC
jgi:hypothetical protein